MTPLQLSILLHYYGHANDFRGGDFSPPAVGEALDWFIKVNMLSVPMFGDNKYALTKKGKFYIDYLLSVPLPTTQYVIDYSGEQT